VRYSASRHGKVQYILHIKKVQNRTKSTVQQYIDTKTRKVVFLKFYPYIPRNMRNPTQPPRQDIAVAVCTTEEYPGPSVWAVI
jgi:hypothetical protein